MNKLVLILFLCINSGIMSQGSSWLSPDFTIEDQAVRMFFLDSVKGHFYIGGNFFLVDGDSVPSMFRIDSNEVVNRLTNRSGGAEPPLAMIRYKDTLFQAGYYGLYAYRDSVFTNYVGKSEAFYNLTVYQGDLLVAGYFWDVVSNHDGKVISYDGNSFAPFYNIHDELGGYQGNSIGCFQEYKGKLYLAGNFTEGNYHEIMSWDGTNWDDMEGGIMGNTGFENISDMAVYKDELYVAGKFSISGSSLSNNIIKWDGNTWKTIGNGLYGQGIADLHVYNDELWVVGAFDSVDHVSLSNVAIWNGSNWCSPGGYFDRTVFVAGEFRDTLYVGGNFRSVDGNKAKKYLVKYNASAARMCGPPVSIEELPVSTKKITVYPNPSNGMFSITIEKGIIPQSIMIHSALGQRIPFKQVINEHEILVTIAGSKGLYTLSLIDQFGNLHSEKILIHPNK